MTTKTYYTRKSLSIENNFCLFQLYLRPHFIYLAPSIRNQSKSLKKKFYKLWNQALKKFILAPQCTCNKTLERLFENPKLIMESTQD